MISEADEMYRLCSLRASIIRANFFLILGGKAGFTLCKYELNDTIVQVRVDFRVTHFPYKGKVLFWPFHALEVDLVCPRYREMLMSFLIKFSGKKKPTSYLNVLLFILNSLNCLAVLVSFKKS